MPEYRINIDKKVLRLLGAQLYGDTSSIIAELVQNSYDADAKNVWITITTGSDETIIVEDDGIGMSPNEINNRFLNIGYNRRDTDPLSPGGRSVLGRKGIGKLAVFSLAKVVDVISKKENVLAGCELDYDYITLQDGDPQEIPPNQINLDDSHLPSQVSGTKIILKKIQKNISRSYFYIVNRLARTFDVNGEDFKIFIRKNVDQYLQLSRAELQYTKKMDTIVTIGDEFNDYYDQVKANKIDDKYKYAVKYPDLTIKQGRVTYTPMPYTIKVLDKFGNTVDALFSIKGWVGTVQSRDDFKDFVKDDSSDSESQTKFEVTVNDNRISIFSRDKMGEYNILPKTQINRITDANIIGEIYADIFEDDSLADMSISNRRGYDESDPRYVHMMDIVTKLVNYLTRVKDDLNKKRRDDTEAIKIQSQNEAIKREMYSGASRTKKILQEKLDPEELQVFEGDMLQFGRVINSANATKKIFISHKHDCKEYGCFLIRIFELLGVNLPETIIFTSIPELGVPHGQDIYVYLKECFRDDLYVIFVLSKSFYDSNPCIAETGAAWATNKHYSNVIVDLGYNDIDNPLNRNSRGTSINDLSIPENLTDLKNLIVTVMTEVGMADKVSDIPSVEAAINQAIAEFAPRLNGLLYIPIRKFQVAPICPKCKNPMRLNYESGHLAFKCTSRSCGHLQEAEICL